MPEHVFRPASESDAPAIATLVNACEADATGERVEPDEVVEFLRGLGRGRAELALGPGGEATGYLELCERAEGMNLDGYVHPAHRGRGLGRAIVRRAEALARPLAATVTSGALGSDPAARALFESEGWSLVRVFYRMAIDLDGSETAPPPPPGLELRTFEHDDAECFHAALEDAFSTHWDNSPQTFERFREDVLEADWFDPSLVWLVLDGEQVVAVSLCRRRYFGSGWIGRLGVRERWRRRGLGEVLLRTAFAEFARRGETRVALGVDAANETGATRLYERVGMRVAFSANVFRKELRSEPQP